MAQERNLIRLGNSSFAISLPIDWIQKSGLKKGDKVFLVQNTNGELIVGPNFSEREHEEKVSKINIDGKDRAQIRREFTAEYIKGSSMFIFSGKIDREKKKIIKKLSDYHLSCEIIEENDKKIKVRDFFNLKEMNINSFVKRTDNNLTEMFNKLIEGLEKGKLTKSEFKEIEEIDLDVNRFYFLISRVLTKGLDNPTLLTMLKLNLKNLFLNWWFVFHLEHIGDSLKTIANKFQKDIDEHAKENLLPFLKKIKNNFQNSLKNFYNDEKVETYNIMQEGKEIVKICDELEESQNAFLSLVGGKLKDINNSSYQIVKMISNMK